MALALAPEEPTILQLFHLMGQAAVTGCTNTIVDFSDTSEPDYGFPGEKNRVFHCASGIIQGILFSSSSGWECLCEYNHSDAQNQRMDGSSS